MFGVAGGAHRIRYERVSLPVASGRPDAAGAVARGGPSQTRWSRLPVHRLAAAAAASGFPVSPSNSAGSYICNASYGAALSANPNSLLIHVPLPAGRGTLSLPGLKAHAAWSVALIRELAG